MRHSAASTGPARRILIVRLSAHGDTAQTLPLLSALRRQAPDSHIGWLVETSAAPLLANHPSLNRLHVLHRKAWLKSFRQCLLNPFRWGELGRTVAGILDFLGELKAERYEVALDVQGLLKSALWPWLSGIPRRIGYARARENAHWLYSETIAPMEIKNPTQGAVQKYLEFLLPLGLKKPPVMAFDLPDLPKETRQRVADLLAPLNRAVKAREDSAALIALAPATRWASKHWPVAHWQGLLGKLLEKGHGVIMLGSAQDGELIAEVIRGFEPEREAGQLLNLAGQTDLGELYALFASVDVLIGPDSAPLHIADAVSHGQGRPRIVALFGPTAPGRTGPVGEAHQSLALDLECQPCFERHCPIKTHACMEELTPDQVFEAVQRILRDRLPEVPS